MRHVAAEVGDVAAAMGIVESSTYAAAAAAVAAAAIGTTVE